MGNEDRLLLLALKIDVFGALLTPESAYIKILLLRHGESFILIHYFPKLQIGLDLIRIL